jgi:XTP/dITP diphosphohydrolase
MEPIYFITGNAMKAKEAKLILPKFGIEVAQKDIDVHEIQDKEASIIAARKAEDAFRILGHPLIVEDTGLYIKAMNGYPGAFIKHFFNSIGPEGIMGFLDGKERMADAVTVVAYCDSGGKARTFEGRVSGRISETIRKRNEFDWDMIFIPDGYEQTYSELDIEEKNEISQRRKALEKFAQWFKSKNV